MKSNLSYYKGSAVFALVCIAVSYLFAGLNGAVLALILSVLETSVSLDNAVVNAKVLETMSLGARKAFLTWGMLISVGFVRLLFPILIVWTTSSLTLGQSFVLPFEDANKYAETVQSAHVLIAGYGGAFLLMVFLSFFLDAEKETHWLPGVEKVLNKIGGVVSNSTYPALMLAIVTVALVDLGLPKEDQGQFATAAVWGIVTWLGVHLFGILMESIGGKTTGAAKTGMMAAVGSFIYLNVLDASFSFDGVVGAFAVSNNIIVIAAGLGAGAMFVRSMTLHMVDKGTLGELVYLEHGAFWSIGALTAMMFAGITVHIPEIVTGLSAAVILGIALVHSLLQNKHSETATV